MQKMSRMVMLMKKLIDFTDEQIDKITKYAEEKSMSFTQAVRVLVEIGLDPVTDINETPSPETTDISALTERIEKLEKDREWWNTDDIQSRVGNLETADKENVKVFEDLDKRINVLTKVSKLFKAHIKDRSIHLQD